MKTTSIEVGGFVAFCVTLIAAAGARTSEPSHQAAEFFESRVRPILTEHCVSCHGSKKQSSGLRLDTRAGLMQGSENGPVLVPGAPEESLLIRAVHRQDEIKMPPKETLAPEAVASLTAWVKMGAPWPEAAALGIAQDDQAIARARQSHWAFQPVKQPPLPEVKDPGRAATPIDRFILAKLDANKLKPAPPANRRTLLRRATFDLIGLPPTPEEVAAFEADRSPDAFARVVDRLLASPHYGERWARYWLDVARYADTKGYVFTEERRFPYAYTYRDYVIRAFNEDLPYDQFIREQLAADRLSLGEDKRPLAAMGFLTLGRRFLNNAHDIIDDRIDVVTRGLLGLTVSCARCHDHKFDPIPTRDYYSLYGVFASSTEPTDLPLLAHPQQSKAYQAYEEELKTREQKLAAFLESKRAELAARSRAQAAAYLLTVHDLEARPAGQHPEPQQPTRIDSALARRWQSFLAERRKRHDPIFAPWHAFAELPLKEFAEKAPDLAAAVAANADRARPINRLVAEAFEGEAPASLEEVAQRYGELLARVDKLWLSTLVKEASAPPRTFADPELESLRQVLYGPGAPADVPAEETRKLLDKLGRNELAALQRRLDQWKAQPVAPPRAMVLQDAPQPVAAHVLLRGNPNNQGEEVPRRFLQVLAGPNRQPFHDGSGRLDLARAIADADNPLTARVFVNRVWLHHFGAGLVRTPSDFGIRGELPTHPDLLDYLACSFMKNGWSIKKLHREILLSRVYQQSSLENRRGRAVDPENRLLWRANRGRLDFEAMRDALLAVSGHLDETQGGPTVDLTTEPFTGRRTVYGFIDRQNLPGLFRTFDFASPDTTSPQRYSTTVPQQALFLMNSPFVIDQARRLAERAAHAEAKHPARRIQYLHRLLYGRKASREEVQAGLRFVDRDQAAVSGEPAEKPLGAWEKYVQVLLLANEFVFVD